MSAIRGKIVTYEPHTLLKRDYGCKLKVRQEVRVLSVAS